MNEADYIIDVGPRAGVHGGEIGRLRNPAQVAANTASITGDYLSGRKKIPVPPSAVKETARFSRCSGG